VRAAGADFQLLGATARGAYAWRLERFAMGPLAGIGLERLGASGFGGTSASFHQSAVWASIEAGAITTYALADWLALRASVRANVPTARPSFVVLEATPAPAALVHTPAAVSASAAIGLEARFF
jgi:hypothetical protein